MPETLLTESQELCKMFEEKLVIESQKEEIEGSDDDEEIYTPGWKNKIENKENFSMNTVMSSQMSRPMMSFQNSQFVTFRGNGEKPSKKFTAMPVKKLDRRKPTVSKPPRFSIFTAKNSDFISFF